MAIDMIHADPHVEAAGRVLTELIQVLGEYHEHMIVVGGWVPFLWYGPTHIGSMDVDIALDRTQISNDVYKTIRKLLEARGYRDNPDHAYSFLRNVTVDGTRAITVAVDFLGPEYDGTPRSGRIQDVQDVKSVKARGCDLALKYHRSLRLHGTMPEEHPTT